MTDAQLVSARVAAMKEDAKILKGAKSLSGDAAVAAATEILKNFSNFPSLFRPNSITPDSRATAKIWENWGDFTARLNAEKANAQGMLAAAKAGDKKAYEAAISAVKKPCSDCHLTYARVFWGRRPIHFRHVHLPGWGLLLSRAFIARLRAMKTANRIICSIICC